MALIGFFSLSNAQLATINENFDSFVANITPSFPQNSWTSSTPAGFENYMVVVNEEGTNKFVQGYAFTQVNKPHYLISPQIIAPDGTKTLSFEASKFTQSGFMGTIEAGLVSSPTDMDSFTSLGAAVTLQTTTPQTFTYNVPASTQQYIAFKFVGLNNHASTRLDNITYGISNLAVNDTRNNSKLGFTVNGDNLVFVGKTGVKEIKVYNTAGRMIKINKNGNNHYNISGLAIGTYMFEALNDNGTILKSKFIKQ